MGQAESKEQAERAPQSSTDTTLAAPETSSQQTLTEPPDTISQGTGEGQRHSETTATTADSGATMPAGSSWGGLRRSLSTGLGWTASSLEALKAAEGKILATVPGLKVFDTNIGNGQHIHTVEGGKENKSQAPIVLCHGYGMGVAAWQLVLNDLSCSTHVLAKDWLGCGQSSRPKWEAKGVAETEAFFVESLEKWREVNRVEKMTLCGHSLGGYMGVAYAEKYPERLERLVLVSPVGFPEEPEGYRATIEEAPFTRRNLWRFLMWGWKKGITPGDVVRTLGPMGYRMMMTYSERRFLADFDRQAMGDYLYHNLAATDGSGERALSQVLKPGAWAHSPLRHRLPKIDSSIPVHFIYGDHDWMDATAVEELKEAAEAEKTGQTITIARIPSSGHQLFLDNPKGFTAELLRVCGIDFTGLVDDGRE